MTTAAQSTTDTPAHPDHDDQLQRMIDAYQRPITGYLNESGMTAGVVYERIRDMVRNGIEQAFHAGHACAPGHATGGKHDHYRTGNCCEHCKLATP